MPCGILHVIQSEGQVFNRLQLSKMTVMVVPQPQPLLDHLSPNCNRELDRSAADDARKHEVMPELPESHSLNIERVEDWK